MVPETSDYALRSDLARVENLTFRALSQSEEAVREARSVTSVAPGVETALAVTTLGRLIDHVLAMDSGAHQEISVRVICMRQRDEFLNLLLDTREVLLRKVTQPTLRE